MYLLYTWGSFRNPRVVLISHDVHVMGDTSKNHVKFGTPVLHFLKTVFKSVTIG